MKRRGRRPDATTERILARYNKALKNGVTPGDAVRLTALALVIDPALVVAAIMSEPVVTRTTVPIRPYRTSDEYLLVVAEECVQATRKMIEQTSVLAGKAQSVARASAVLADAIRDFDESVAVLIPELSEISTGLTDAVVTSLKDEG